MRNNYITIAYIAGRLISGKRIASLYDYAQSQHIFINSLPDAEHLKEFDYLYRDYIPGYSSDCRFQYVCSTGHSIVITIDGSSFIGHIRGTSFYFLGNVRKDSIYIFDHEKSHHINYRISGCVVEHENNSKICNTCWLTK